MKRWFVSLFLLTLWIAACQGGDAAAPDAAPAAPAGETAAAPTPPEPAPTATPAPTPTPDPLVRGTAGYPWWNDTVFYEIFVRSFYDSNGDGIGDLNGIIEKLDYLNDGDPATTDDLGITGIWLMPIADSPSYHGYDVVDYLTVNPEYGSNADFERLIAAAHARGIRVIVDLVLNHTSRDHPWFQEARSSATAEKRDWYIWSAENPGYVGPDGQTVWHQTPTGYYYAVFWDGMPDLNYENREVTAAMLDVSRFWLEEMGADGFRIDGAKHLIEKGPLQENTSSTISWFADFYAYYKSVNPDAFAVGEVWSSTQQVLKYVGTGFDVAFEFDLAGAILSSVRSNNNQQLARALAKVVDDYPPGQYATFLANHDMDRTLSQLDGNEAKARLAATVLLTAPGVPFIYYGEEIGMTGVRGRNTDEPRRLPMQWSAVDRGVGFTTGRPWSAAAADYAEHTVADQTAVSDSLLSHYRGLIHLRNAHAALRVGDWLPLETNSRSVYAFLRYTADEVILVLLNLDPGPVSDYSLALEAGPLAAGAVATPLLSSGPLPGSDDVASPDVTPDGGLNGYLPLPELSGQTSYVIRLAP